MRCSLALITAWAVAGVAGAQISVDSRLSKLHDYSTDSSPFFTWDESGTFTGPGTGTITLTHGATHTFTVTTSVISGTLSGFSQRSQGYMFADRETTLDTVLTFTTDTKVTIKLNGDVSEGQPPGVPVSGPTDHNAYFHIDRTSGTTGAVFDAFSEGAPTPPGTMGYQAWNHTTWTATLSAGTYHIIGGAQGKYVYDAGSGNSYGAGQIAVNMTMVSVPAPATGVLMAMGGAFAARRRRN